MSIQQLTVLGAGVLGAQIAFQAAYHGTKVISYDIDDNALQAAKMRFDKLAQNYRRDLGADDDAIWATFANLTQSSDLEQSVKDADIVIEAVPENIDLKRQVWTQVGKFAKQDCIFATNTSTLLPSQFAAASGDTSRFLAMHFANNIWVQNIVEIMATADTDPACVQSTLEFGKQMGMVPVEVKKEHAGYIMNSLVVPLLHAASHLLADGVAEFQDIDKVWRMATGAPFGPFEAMDIVGLRTVYAIHSVKAQSSADPLSQRFVEMIKNEYLDKGRFGKEVNRGFYDYDEYGNRID
ncbi:3-hydroxybutyryl-CoA dehydrogenase [Moraxella ovis]|uniref:3-hydroxybutyryl-CoA dehydrogenase n=1 Tax=Moraxella ovis TaxID=29433 RepID=A0A378PLL5_9GAMM|nr:3-hydroxyacyl-CoA dehydrogenase [Moraxella ovis]ANB91926.1 3-hydroxybutyryl-CoA dehydrogenase [Moraxella ovis]STY87662.1 3-hydroxybutyryl-CoA dehydrogenase [Moraxella ovis]